MKYLARIALLALIISTVCCTTGVDVSAAVSESGWKCLHNNNHKFAIPRAWKSYGAYDTNAKANIAGAKSAGFANVDVYMFPCRGHSASDQVSSLVSNLGAAQYGMIWIDVEVNPSSGCSWSSYSHSSNC